MKKILALGLITLNTLGLGWTVNKVTEISNKVENIQVIQTLPTNTKQEEVQIQEVKKEEPIIEKVEPVVKKEIVEVVKEVPVKTEETKKETEVKIEEVQEIQEDEEVVEVERKQGTQVVELEDGSSVVYNYDQSMYTFYPSNMGDWYYNFDNEQHLDWAIQTHLELMPKVEKISSIEIVNTETHDDGDVIIELNDGSSLMYNENTNEYYFWASNMGDWELQVRNAQELKNVVATYMEITHGL